MPKPAPTAKNVAAVLEPLLHHLKEADKHLFRAVALFPDMPRSAPNATRRIDKINTISNELSSLRIKLIQDAHGAAWCTDEIHDELARIEKKNRGKS